MTGDAPFRGKTALVTGGASGIGEATVRMLAAQGAGVCIVDQDEVARWPVGQANHGVIRDP